MQHRKNARYNYSDAYKLITYQSDDGTESEDIWNSRDGIVPFMVPSRTSGKHLVRFDWMNERRYRQYTPKPGSRIIAGSPEAPRLMVVANT